MVDVLTAPAVSHRSSPLRRAGAVLVPVGVTATVVAGAFFRLWILGRERTNADEAIVGLMAREILHGHFFAFYWGQHYGGGEPYVVALAFAILGQSSFVLRLTPVLLDVVAAVLVWRVGTRLFSVRVGLTAALLFWIWPEAVVWQSTLEYGFRMLALDLGLLLMLCALRLDGADLVGARRVVEGGLLGLALGLGWWCTPEIAYFAIPALGWLGWRAAARRLVVGVGAIAAGVLGAVVGALPWLWSNLGDGFASLATGSNGGVGYGSRLGVVWREVFPILIGLKLRLTGHWLTASSRGGGAWRDLAPVAAIVAAIGIVAVLVGLVATRSAPVLVAAVVVFPFLYAWFPTSWFWRDGRYAVFGAPLLALLVAVGADALAGEVARVRRRGPARGLFPLGIAVVLAGVLTGLAATKLEPYRPVVSPGRTGWFSWRADPNEAAVALVKGLEARGIRFGYAGYWIAYLADFESRGGLVLTNAGPAYTRYRPFLAAVDRSPRPVYVFANPRFRGQNALQFGTHALDLGCAAASETCLTTSELERWLARHGIGYRRFDVASFVVVQPDRFASAASVLSTYHLS